MILTERAKQAALTQPLSPHDMRRSYVGDLLDAGDCAAVCPDRGVREVEPDFAQ